MADVVGSSFHELMRDMFNAQGSNVRFRRDYQKALVLTLNEIGIEANMATQPTVPTDTNSIDLDEDFENALFWGVSMYLIVFGQRTDGIEYNDANNQYTLAKTNVSMFQHHERQKDRDTDETDMVGIGYQT